MCLLIVTFSTPYKLGIATAGVQAMIFMQEKILMHLEEGAQN